MFCNRSILQACSPSVVPTLTFANERQLTLSQDHSRLVGFVYFGRNFSGTAATFTLLCPLATVDLAMASAAVAVDDSNSTIGHSE